MIFLKFSDIFTVRFANVVYTFFLKASKKNRKNVNNALISYNLIYNEKTC